MLPEPDRSMVVSMAAFPVDRSTSGRLPETVTVVPRSSAMSSKVKTAAPSGPRTPV